MNPGPGNSSLFRQLAGSALWLAWLMLSLSATAAAQVTPGMPGQPPGMPGAVPGMPGMTPYLPGAAPGLPGVTPGVPGFNPFPFGGPYSQQIPPQIQTQFPQIQDPVQSQIPGTAPGSFSWPPSGQQPRQQPGQQRYRPQNPWTYPPMQTAPAYQPQQPAQVVASPPYLEIEVESNTAYVHQNLVLTVNLISTVNLKTATAQMQDSDDVIFRQLGDATAKTRTRGGQTEIVNTLYFQLTPLRSGQIELDTIRVTGDMDLGSGGEAPYDAVSDRAIQLTVSDPAPGVQPWLPLQELVLSANLSNDEEIGEGEPMTLTVVQRAVGMSGTQLPSLENQLQAPDHRLYREKSDYEGIVSKQGQLVGTRTDRYTLVPQEGNEVIIPAIRVEWWNVKRHRKETSVLPSRLLNERSRGSGIDEQAVIGESAGKTLYWVIWIASLAIAFALGRLWPRIAPVLAQFRLWLWQQLNTASQPALRQTAVLLSRMSPRRNLHRLRRGVADSLPVSARLWFCVRSADGEQDPDDWSQVLRFLINRRLGLSAQLPMSKLADRIIEIHPGADADRIRALLAELEAALFAGRPIRDFDAWKREFKRQIRPHVFAAFKRRLPVLRYSGLPELNPSPG